MPQRSIKSWLHALAALLLLAGGSGCLQIDTAVKLNEDGSATITERLNFSRKLLDMAGKDEAFKALTALLSREAAEARVKSMGKDVTLVSHKVQDGEKGSKECVVVYSTPDIQNFVYPSPFLADRDYPGLLQIKLSPYMEHGWADVWPAGAVIVDFRPVYPAGDKPPPILGEKQKPEETAPLDVQLYRELVPVFRDMLQDFQFKIRFETYAPVVSTYGIVHRNARSAVNYVDVISVTDRDLDKQGYSIFENEEIMVEILRWKLAADGRRLNFGPFITDHLAGQGANLTLPVFHANAGGNLLIRPSLPLFKRYFEGKNLKNRNGSFPAKWEEIGYQPPRTRKNVEAEKAAGSS